MKSRVVVLVPVVTIMMACSAFACGPFFDDAYLVRGSEQEFLSMPEGDFKYELEQISGKKSQPQIQEQATWDKPKVEYDALRTKTADADIDDVKMALKTSKVPDWQKMKAIAAYSERRTAITEYVKGYVPTNPWIWYGDQFRSEQKDAVKIKIASDFSSPFLRLVPKEFILYSEGAIEYHNGAFDDAIKRWATLLNLPATERQYRSVWASFMIGKTYLSLNKGKESAPYFEMARKLAAEGYKDTLDLSQESYGWQALAEYETGQYAESINHYLKTMDVVSMYRVCRTIADLNDADFEKIVNNETALRVLIGWAVSHSSYYFYSNDENTDYIKIATRLTNIIGKNNLNIPASNADRVAWMLYNLGKFQEADRWLIASKERSALAKWIRAKLLIRDGKIEKAIEIMRGLKNSFAKDEEFNRFYGKIGTDVERKINTEHSILLLHRNEYLMAFEVLLQGAYWEDIAYVAEKVLTTAELEAYLKSHQIPGDEKTLGFCYAANIKDPTVKKALEFLLARRFARSGELQKALEYMPTYFLILEYPYNSDPRREQFSPREKLQSYINLLNKAEDISLPNEDRALNYFKAARLIRGYGMELMGTELDPDWFVFNGGFDYDSTLDNRFSIKTEERKNIFKEGQELLKKEEREASGESKKFYKDWAENDAKEWKAAEERRQKLLNNRKIFDGTSEEEARVIDSMPNPLKRFHYRYKAADLMWKCAALLPNNHEMKAEALCLGGTYIKNRDKKEADKFYKALVKTCGDTTLGKEADKIRWFPEMKPEMIKFAN